MVSLSGLKDFLGIGSAVTQILSSDAAKTAGRWGKKGYNKYKEISPLGGAITQVSSQTTILSRVFIDESIVDEVVCPNLMKSIHEWYAAQIIAALKLSNMVDSKRSVQQVMSVVQSGHNARQALLGRVSERAMEQYSFLTNYTGNEDCFGMEAFQLNDLSTPSRSADKPNAMSVGAVKSVTVSDNRIGPMGELYEVTLSNPNSKDLSITVPIFVQMQPSLISAPVAPRFIDMNVDPGLWRRWTMMRAGEISFWKEFVLKKDLLARGKALLKDPQAASAYSEFLRTIASKDKYALVDIADYSTASKSANLANSVVVFSEDTVAQAKTDSAIDLHNPRDRKRYFRDTYTMIIAVIDPIHQRVTIYFNGLDGELDVSYADFKPKDKNFDPNNFVQALQAFSTNTVGRLR